MLGGYPPQTVDRVITDFLTLLESGKIYNYSSVWWYLFRKAPPLAHGQGYNLQDLAKKVTTLATKVKQTGFPTNSVDE